MKHHRFIFITLCFLPMLSFSMENATTEKYYKSMLAMSENNCKNRGSAVSNLKMSGKISQAEATQIGEWSLCDCMPSTIKENLKNEPIKSLKKTISKNEFNEIFNKRVVQKCTSQQMKMMYSEPSCRIINSINVSNTDTFCNCMSDYIGKQSEETLFKVSQESGSYGEKVNQAKTRGLPNPKIPNLLSKFMKAQSSCANK